MHKAGEFRRNGEEKNDFQQIFPGIIIAKTKKKKKRKFFSIGAMTIFSFPSYPNVKIDCPLAEI